MQESSVRACKKKHTRKCTAAVPFVHRLHEVELLTTSSKTSNEHKKGAFALMPLPKIDELFALLKGVRYFTPLDLQSSYYHIQLD